MIFRQYFPRYGGGLLRRWWRVRNALVTKNWTKIQYALKGPVPLYDFSIASDAIDAARVSEGSRLAGWRISDDSVIGGFSKHKFQLIRNEEDLQLVESGEEPTSIFDTIQYEGINDKDDDEDDDDDDDDYNYDDDDDEDRKEFIPFVRWSGSIDTYSSDPNVHRSGYCAIQAPRFPFGGLNIRTRYNAIEFLCRPDDRSYSVNLEVTSFFPDDLYVARITPQLVNHPDTKDVDGFKRVIFSFRDFTVTSGGRERVVQRVLDGAIEIRNLGVTLMDGEEGPFQLDLARIRLVNMMDGLILGEEDEDAPY